MAKWLSVMGGEIAQTAPRKFVRVIGWRSTKIRLSGKNTLVIIPNSNLAQTSIENLTRARCVISIIELTFFRNIPDEEQALVEQLVLDSTRDILGIDHRLTQVTFEDITQTFREGTVQAQIIFFILGAAENSMELRWNLLEIAQDNIVEHLQEYGVAFNVEEKTLDISQPMNPMADLTRILLEAFEVDGNLREFLTELGLRVGLFALGVIFSPLWAGYCPFCFGGC